LSSFLAAPPSATAPAVADAIVGDGWWPDLSIAAFRAATRVGELVTPARAREALLHGFISVDADPTVRMWRAAQLLLGATKLDEVTGPSIDGEKRAVLLWRRAVYASAAADLAETHGSISATDAGRDRAEDRATSADEHRRNAIVAVRDLTGRRRSRVSLL
jgi:hypothetical protein